MIAVPNPHPANDIQMNAAISTALLEAQRLEITGNAVTPYLLDRVQKLSSGLSLDANIALVRNNVKIAVEIAHEYKNLSAKDTDAVVYMNCATTTKESSSIATPAAMTSTSSVDGRIDIVVVGGAVQDIIGSAYPGNETIFHSSNPGIIRSSLGGVGRNIAASLATRGVSTTLLTALGKDDSGQNMLYHCSSIGLDTASIKRLPEKATARYVGIHDSSGDLTIGIADMAILREIDAEYIEMNTSRIQNCRLVISDGNISVEAFQKLVLLCESYNKPLFFEPTSDHKCVLPVHAQVLNKISVVKPNVSELAMMVSYALDRKLLHIENSSQKETLVECVERIKATRSSKAVKIDKQKIYNIDDVKVLAKALYRLMLPPSTLDPASKSDISVVKGRHVIVSMGSQGVLWCGPANMMPSMAVKENSQSCFDSALLDCGTLYAPALPVDNVIIHNTNGAGDAFCAGFIQEIINSKDTSLPSLDCINAGLLASQQWLLANSSKK